MVTVAPTAVAGGSKYPELNGLRSDAPGGGVFGAAGGAPELCPLRFSRTLQTAFHNGLYGNGCVVLLLSTLALCRAPQQREETMSMVKVLELSAQSPEGWEAATRQAVERASRTLRNIRSVWVKEFEAVVENNGVTQFRVNVKISFELEDAGSVE